MPGPTFTVTYKRWLEILWRTQSEILTRIMSLEAGGSGGGGSTTGVELYDTLAAMKAESNYANIALFYLAVHSGSTAFLVYTYEPTSTATPNDVTVVQLDATSVGRLLQIQTI